jgi:cell division protein FtsN
MARYERGVYEPDGELRVFDGSDNDQDTEGSRLSLLIVLARLVLAMFAGVVWLAYTQGVARGRTETPVLAAAPGPAKTANSGGQQTPYKDFKIYEQPAPADDEADTGPAAAGPAQAGETAVVQTTPAVAPAPPSVSQMVTTKAPAPPVPVPQAEVAAAPKTLATKTQSPINQSMPAKTTVSKPIGLATAPPKKLGASVPIAASTPVPAATAPAAGGYALQIGAYKSQEDASAAWRAYRSKHAVLLAGYAQDVQRADLGDKGVWYRLRIAGFASKDVADAMCDQLKADGGNCIPAK